MQSPWLLSLTSRKIAIPAKVKPYKLFLLYKLVVTKPPDSSRQLPLATTKLGRGQKKSLATATWVVPL
jgi:hypothetical protein